MIILNRIVKTKSEVFIKPDRSYIINIIVISLIFFGGLYIAFSMKIENFTFLEITGIGIMVIYLLMSLCGVLLSLKYFTHKITIDSNGITTWDIFEKTFISWSEVEDFGLMLGARSSCLLYFSKSKIPVKGKLRKNLGFKVFYNSFSTFVDEIEYQRLIDEVIGFCREYTDLEPFIPEYKIKLFDF